MMVWENVLLPQLRNIHSDSVNGESVYSNSMVTEMSSLLANALYRCTFIHTHAHICLYITMVRIFHLHIHLLIVTPNMPDPEGRENQNHNPQPQQNYP